jgi:hypothetical protein
MMEELRNSNVIINTGHTRAKFEDTTEILKLWLDIKFAFKTFRARVQECDPMDSKLYGNISKGY